MIHADNEVAGRVLRPDVQTRTSEIIDDYFANARWRVPAQRALASIAFWMQANKVSKRSLATRMHISEQAMGQLLNIDSDFKLSTLARLAHATGLDLFAIMATPEPLQPAEPLPPAAPPPARRKKGGGGPAPLGQAPLQ